MCLRNYPFNFSLNVDLFLRITALSTQRFDLVFMPLFNYTSEGVPRGKPH